MRILYIDIDTLRPDHLSCYGYLRKTSPNIDLIAAEGMRFNNYYVPDAPCLPSRTAMFTGRFGFCTGVVNHGGRFADMDLEDRCAAFDDAGQVLVVVVRVSRRQQRLERHHLPRPLHPRGGAAPAEVKT